MPQRLHGALPSGYVGAGRVVTYIVEFLSVGCPLSIAAHTEGHLLGAKSWFGRPKGLPGLLLIKKKKDENRVLGAQNGPLASTVF
jgi:hypothetical protein